ncbi:MAG: beta-lactamase family protein [Planctomycetes bacterium]|nr:beta-lactamase family protein [Planctomycetota bacterium]
MLPKTVAVFNKRLYRFLRLISTEKFKRPIKRRTCVLTSIRGWIFFVLGTIILWQLPLGFIHNKHHPRFYSHHIAIPDNSLSSVPDDLKVRIDQVLSSAIKTNENIGISVGIVYGEDTASFGYGKVDLNKNLKPEGSTIYEIGSITKVFTAILLADMAEKGIVDFNDPIGKFTPSSVQTPEFNGNQIRLIDLASHLSGLPRLPNNLYKFGDYFSLSFIKNPYANYDPQRLYAFLSQYELNRMPGKKYEYSNVGMGLLGHVLAIEQRTTYEDLILNHICNQLDMNDTRIALSSEQQLRFAKGYDGIVSVPVVPIYLYCSATNWDIPTISGAGALRSNVNDLMKFLSANMGVMKTPLNKAMKRSQVVSHRINPNMNIAMGWHILHLNEHNIDVIWHNGGTGGYSSYIGFARNYEIGIVVLSNSTSSVDEIGIRILEMLICNGKTVDNGTVEKVADKIVGLEASGLYDR